MREKKAYTLVEVLVTVTIMAILGGIAIPSFSKSVDKAEVSKVSAYLRTIRAAQRVYFSKNGGYACQVSTDCNTAAKIKTVLASPEVASSGTYQFLVWGSPTAFMAKAQQGSTPSFSSNCNSGASYCGSPAKTICLNESGAWSGTSSYVPSGTG